MKTRYIPALITLIAAACISIMNIVRKVEPKEGLQVLLITIIVFYIVGLIAKSVLTRSLTNQVDDEAQKDASDELQELDTPDTDDKSDENVE